MTGANYPADWADRRREVIRDHMNRCANCHTTGGLSDFHVHHVVPISQAGTHRTSNLVPLCGACHRAAHGKEMAPCVRWFTNGELSNDEFDAHKALWKEMRDQLGVPRYDSGKECVYIPLADKERILEEMPT